MNATLIRLSYSVFLWVDRRRNRRMRVSIYLRNERLSVCDAGTRRSSFTQYNSIESGVIHTRIHAYAHARAPVSDCLLVLERVLFRWIKLNASWRIEPTRVKCVDRTNGWGWEKWIRKFKRIGQISHKSIANWIECMCVDDGDEVVVFSARETFKIIHWIDFQHTEQLANSREWKPKCYFARCHNGCVSEWFPQNVYGFLRIFGWPEKLLARESSWWDISETKCIGTTWEKMSREKKDKRDVRST